MNLFRIAIVVLVLFTSVIEAKQPLKFELNLWKDTYLVGEAIDLGRNVINSSPFTQKITGNIYIKLVTQSGEVKQYLGPRGSWFYPSGELKPGEESYDVIDINEYFGKRYCISHYHHILETGIYTVEVLFYASGGQIDTSKISFQIVQPEGDEAIVLNSYMDFGKNSAKYSSPKFFDALSSLMNSHPHSVYNPIILSEILSTFRITLHDLLEGLATGKELVEKYPWSAKGAYILDAVLNSFATEQERIVFLKKLLPFAQNSPMQRLLELKLKAKMEE